MLKRILLVFAATAFLAIAGMAQDKPNFSGTWKLNTAKSNFGQFPAPSSRVDVIEQTGVNFRQVVDSEGQNGKQHYDLSFTTDGKETTFPAGSTPQIGRMTLQKISAFWQGSALVVSWAMKFQDSDGTAKNTYTLSADGKIYSVDSEMDTPMGEVKRKFVFDKVIASAPRAAAAPAPATAVGAKPDLSGTWKLNPVKSDFGPMPPPDGMVDTIDDHDPAIKITTQMMNGPMGDVTTMKNLSTDGKETTSTFAGGGAAKNTAHWDGNALIVVTKAKMQEDDITLTETYTLSADGKSIAVASHFSGPMGEADMNFVFDKQP